MSRILAWLEQYPPEERDGSTLRNADFLLTQWIDAVERDYETHKHSNNAVRWLKEAFEEDRLKRVAMRERVRNTIALKREYGQ